MNEVDNRSKRWIRFTVDMFDHPALKSKEFDRCSAFAWLIANAAWKDHKVRMGNSMVEIKRGQVIVGLEHLSKEWGWGVKKVRLFLELLISEGMLEKGTSKGRFANIATICNYETYQTPQDQQGQVEGQVQDKLRAGSGQHSTKDTNNTNKYTDTREREVVDFNDLSKSLLEACNGALADPCNAQGLLIMSQPLAWIEQGCDLQKDILPTLRAVSTVAHRNGKRIKSWDYFTNAVVEAKARREAPLPAPTLTTSDPPKRSMLPSELMALKRKQQQLETSGETNG